MHLRQGPSATYACPPADTSTVTNALQDEAMTSIVHYRPLTRCRVSGSRNLVSVLNLGHQILTGVFPKDRNAEVTAGPLELMWCPDSGLLQLGGSFDASEMYGDNY